MTKDAEKRKRGLRLGVRFRAYKRQNYRKGKVRTTSIVYQILTAVVVLILIEQAIEGKYQNCFTCGLTLLLFLAPNFFEKRLKVTLPQTLEVIIILFIFSAEMLGEIKNFYLRFAWWDNMLHTMNGFLMAAIGFSMVDILNKNDRFKFYLSPLFMAVVSFCFSMTIGVLWEFFEFIADVWMLTDMQKDTILATISSVNLNPDGLNVPMVISGIEEVVAKGSNLMIGTLPAQGGEYILSSGGYIDIGLIDTMNDLVVNFIGAVLFSIFGYFYIKGRGKGKFVENFIPKRDADK